MEKVIIDDLINRRPKVYSWLGFQRFLLWLFFILGIVFFINTCAIILTGILKFVLIEETSRQIAAQYNLNQKDIESFLLNWLAPIKFKIILYSFFLSTSFFIISRYCQKVINRNRYILLLENEWNKVKNSLHPAS